MAVGPEATTFKRKLQSEQKLRYAVRLTMKADVSSYHILRFPTTTSHLEHIQEAVVARFAIS